ncbi:hypothetical protein [Janthinobacterium sp. PC23-8]|uniref:hypothetical protein n=1 Tax=Janthinobacterium sp. PC23-8 TaxID=2012679 RepID=UPI0011404F26|nr:hypothetical protein [Janthinobacterium sp. PC23-8]
MELQTSDLNEIGAALGVKSSIALLRTLGGKSGAGVWLVDIQLEAWSGIAILKLERLENVIGRVAEATAHSIAEGINKKFTNLHIAKLVAFSKTNNHYVSLFAAVGGGMENCRSMKSLLADDHKDVCQRITSDLLNEWNSSASEADSVFSESKILQLWLGYRLNKIDGGRIEKKLLDFGIGGNEKGFSYAGIVYPNPYYWSKNDNLYIDAGIRPIVGHLHNDLHEENILRVPGEFGKDVEYFVIDFALAEPQKPLLFDQAYLEFSSLLVSCENMSIQTWIEEITKLSTVERLQDLYGKNVDRYRISVAESIIEIRHQINRWTVEKYSSRRAHVYRQQLLSRMAAALNFFNKNGLSRQAELKALIYAAISLRAYFSYCKVDMPATECALIEPEIKLGLDTKKIREACHFVDSFEVGRHLYILVSALESDELIAFDPTVASRVNWPLVIDCSTNSENGSFFSLLGSQIEKSQVVRVKLPDGINNFTPKLRSTTWLKARGWSKQPESESVDLLNWKRKKLNKIRNSMSELFNSISPLSVRVVVLQGNYSSEYTAEICAALYETCGIDDIRALVLGGRIENSSMPADTVFEYSGDPVERIIAGIDLSLGEIGDAAQVLIPSRIKGDEGSIEYRDITNTHELAVIAEELELVHAGLRLVETHKMEGKFLRGAPISWPELDLEQDLIRDVYSETKMNLQKALSDPRNRMFEIKHKPGAGGSTFARRLFWDLKRQFPVAVLRGINSNTALRVETLFHLSSLPVLLLAEADVCTREDVSRLLHTASSRNVRCCVLFVSRFTGSAPPSQVTDSFTFISDVMPLDEAKKFLGRYSTGASLNQLDQLRRLATTAEKQRFRSPFFFGLYRFEEEFSHVSEYVRGHLHDLTDRQKILLSYVSLVSVFTQSGVPEQILATLNEKKYTPGTMVGRVFGQDVDRLFVTYGSEGSLLVKASHPLLAQQTLEVIFDTNRHPENTKWQEKLSNLSIRMIKEFTENESLDGPEFKDLLMQMFIQREHLSADSGRRNLFSPLLTEIYDEPYQAEILRQLTAVLPNEPHFWNHFGRHCMYSESKRFKDAIENLNLAIELAPDDELHLHTLGMIYAHCVRETLQQFRSGSHDHVVAWTDISNDYRSARDCFLNARVLSNGASQYPFVSDIQLVTRTVSSLRAISGAASFYDFLIEETSISLDIRNELSSANDLLSEVKRLTDEKAEHPEYVEAVDFYLKKIEKSSDELSNYLLKKVAEPGGNTVQNRRFLLSVCQLQKKRGNTSFGSPERFVALLSMAEKNIDTTNPSDQDFRHWLALYRDSQIFSMIEAIDKVTRWNKTIGSIDSSYYLYILYFAQWYDGEITNVEVVAKALDQCLSLSQERNRKQSFEYLAKSQSGIGIVAADQLGERDPATGFFTETEKLAYVDGIIKEIRGPQAGTITVIPLWKPVVKGGFQPRSVEAFFIPGENFHADADENVAVRFFLGFRRGGLRAHIVERTSEINNH